MHSKKGQESPVKENNYEFLPLFISNLGMWHLKCYSPLNEMSFEGFSREYGVSFF